VAFLIGIFIVAYVYSFDWPSDIFALLYRLTPLGNGGLIGVFDFIVVSYVLRRGGEADFGIELGYSLLGLVLPLAELGLSDRGLLVCAELRCPLDVVGSKEYPGAVGCGCITLVREGVGDDFGRVYRLGLVALQ
jgi:hypothetical protein